jgi:uncharacterized protein (UPF0333 family)
MKKQNGVISTGAIVAIVLVVSLVSMLAILIGIYSSYYNLGNRSEQNLIAARDQAKNILATYGQKVQEVAQVPSMYTDDLKKLTDSAIQSRYGAEGSKAMFQFLKEQNPTLDPTLYRQIQQVIEAGRNDFQSAQERQIDVRRQYQTELGNFFSGIMLHMAGYPKIDLKEFDIVSTDRADNAFKNHKEDGPIKLR